MISNNDQRVLVDNAGTFTDLTKEVSSYTAGLASVTLGVGDFLYFGSFLPFNQKYLELSPGSTASASLTIELWDGANWKVCADVLDYTELLGKPLGKSGTLQFNKVDEDNWGLESRSTDVPALAGAPEIYGKYWLRLSLSSAASLGLKYVGSMFASHDDFVGEYPFLRNANLINAWKDGKTDWKAELVKASEYVIADLKKRNIIIERSQVIEQSVLLEPTIHRAAVVIFSGLGVKNYEAEIKMAADGYKRSMDLIKFEQDVNGNGQKERFEQVVTTARATR